MWKAYPSLFSNLLVPMYQTSWRIICNVRISSLWTMLLLKRLLPCWWACIMERCSFLKHTVADRLFNPSPIEIWGGREKGVSWSLAATQLYFHTCSCGLKFTIYSVGIPWFYLWNSPHCRLITNLFECLRMRLLSFSSFWAISDILTDCHLSE